MAYIGDLAIPSMRLISLEVARKVDRSDRKYISNGGNSTSINGITTAVVAIAPSIEEEGVVNGVRYSKQYRNASEVIHPFSLNKIRQF